MGWDRTASSYAQGDATWPREPSRDFVPSPWVQQAVETAKASATAITAAVAIAVIVLLGSRK